MAIPERQWAQEGDFAKECIKMPGVLLQFEETMLKYKRLREGGI